ncbi:MAG TPA: hypothetical protein VFJ17_09000 [Mycobacteriales bacterium]|jgi:hypothetical protein|nr:hypothetical protein [Mycobacteriales bacterium]
MRRLLRPGGRHAFTTIHTPPDLTPAQHRLAGVAGPPAVAGADPAELLRRAGFSGGRAHDVTDDYLAVSIAWRAARVRHRDELRPLDPDVFDDRLQRGAHEAEALRAGLLRRTLYVATRPPAG